MRQNEKRKLAILLSLSMCISIITPDTLLAREVVTDLNGEESVSQSTISEQEVSENQLMETVTGESFTESFTGSSTECIASSNMDYSTGGNSVIVSYNMVLKDGYHFYNNGIKIYDEIDGKWCYRAGKILEIQSGATSVSFNGVSCVSGYGKKKVVLFANIYKDGDTSTNYSEVSVIEREITIKDAKNKDKFVYIQYKDGGSIRLGYVLDDDGNLKKETKINGTGITFNPDSATLTFAGLEGEYTELDQVSGYDKLKVVIQDEQPVRLGAPDTIIELDGNTEVTFDGCGVGGLIATGKTIHNLGNSTIGVNGSAILSNVNLDCELRLGEAFLSGCTLKGNTMIDVEDLFAENCDFYNRIYVERDFTAKDCTEMIAATITNGGYSAGGSMRLDGCSVSMNKRSITARKEFTATNTDITDGATLKARHIKFQEDSLFQADIGSISGYGDICDTIEIDRSTISINSAGNHIIGILCKKLTIDNSKITVPGIYTASDGSTIDHPNVIIKNCDSIDKKFTCTDKFTIDDNCTALIQNSIMEFPGGEFESKEGTNIILSNTQMKFLHTGDYSRDAIRLDNINSFQSDDSCSFDFQKYQTAFDISGNPLEIKGKIQADVQKFIKSITPVTFSGTAEKRQEIKVLADDFYYYNYGESALTTNYVDIEFIENESMHYYTGISVANTLLLKNTNAIFKVKIDNSNCNILNGKNITIEDSKVLLSGNAIGISTVSDLNVNHNSVIKCYTNSALNIGADCTMDGELQVLSGSVGSIAGDFYSAYSKMMFYGNRGLDIGGDSFLRYANIEVDQTSINNASYLFKSVGLNSKKFNLKSSSIYGKAEISNTNNSSFVGIRCNEGEFNDSIIDLCIKGEEKGVIGISTISDCNIRNKSHVSMNFITEGEGYLNLIGLKGEGNLFLSEDSRIDLSSENQSGLNQMYQAIDYRNNVTLEGNTDINFSSDKGTVGGIQCNTLMLYRNTVSTNMCGGDMYLIKCENLLMDYANFIGKEKISDKMEQSHNDMVQIEKQMFLDRGSNFLIEDSNCTAEVIDCGDSIILDGKSSLKIKDISLVSGNQYDMYVNAVTGKTLLLKGGSKFIIDKINTRGEKDIQNINILNASNIYVRDNSYLGIKNAELLNNKMYAQAEICTTNAMHLDDTAVLEISGVKVDNQTDASMIRLNTMEEKAGILSVSGNSQLSIQDISSEGSLKGISGKTSLSKNGVISIRDLTGAQDVYGVNNYEAIDMDGKTLWIDVKTKGANNTAYGISGKVKLTNGEVSLFAQNDGKGKAAALDTIYLCNCEIGTDSFQPHVFVGSNQESAKLQPETYQFKTDYQGEAYVAFTKGTKSPSQPSVPENPDDPEDPEDPDNPENPEIPQKLLSDLDAKIAPIKSLDYSGNEIKPTIKLSVVENKKKKTLVEGFDYKVIYKNHISAGIATVQVEGLREYKGTITKTFEIKPRSIKKVKCLVEDMILGQDGKPVIQLYDGKNLLVENVDYKVDVPENLTDTKGKKKLVITGLSSGGNGNYKDGMKASLTVYDKGILISKATISMNVPEEGYTYNGKAKKPTVQVSMNGKELREKKDYTITYQNNKEAGTAYVIVKGKKDYCGTSLQKFEIKAVAGDLKLNTIKNKTYNGKQQKTAITVKSANKKLKANKDYMIVYGDCTHAGSVSVNIIGKGNYAGSQIEATYLINPQQMKKASVKLVRGQIEVTYNKKKLYKNLDYTVTLGEKKNGKTEVTIKAVEGGDFTGTVVKKLKL